jgi:phosphoribosylformylglycinamidine synthase
MANTSSRFGWLLSPVLSKNIENEIAPVFFAPITEDKVNDSGPTITVNGGTEKNWETSSRLHKQPWSGDWGEIGKALASMWRACYNYDYQPALPSSQGKCRRLPSPFLCADPMANVKALILRAPGSNCDVEAQFAFEQAGAVADRLHINRLRESPQLLLGYQVLVIPGGFTYGDDVAAGKILANQLTHFLGDSIRRFRDSEKLILGICNGFQVLLKAGLLVSPDEEGPVATLAHNAHGKFEDRWIYLKATAGKCPFLKGLDRLHLPIAHGEGRFVCRMDWQLQGLIQSGQAVLRYVDAAGKPGGFPVNPNGSQGDIAGICDASGRVMGLMPHPERHVLPTQHPRWTRLGLASEGDGLAIFRNAVRFFM